MLPQDTAGNKLEKTAMLRVNADFESRKREITMPSVPLAAPKTTEVVKNGRNIQARRARAGQYML